MKIIWNLKNLFSYQKDAWVELYKYESGSGHVSQSYFVPDKFPGASLWYSVIKNVALLEIADSNLEEHSFLMRGTKEGAILWALDILKKNSDTWFGKND